MRIAYGLRSKIVHGSQVKTLPKIAGKPVPLAEFVERIEDHIRTAARSAVLSSTQKFSPQWDDDIVGAKAEQP